MIRLILAGLALPLLATAASIPNPTPRSSSVPAIYTVTPDEWASLNSSVGGRLGAGRPIDLPCYANYNGTANNPDLATCNKTQSMKSNSNFIADYFGGYEYVSLLSRFDLMR